MSACERLKLDPYLSPCTNINSKWIKDLNIRPGTLKQLQERVGHTWEHIDIGNSFLNKNSNGSATKKRLTSGTK
jgi:hypothetical protein